MHFSVATIQEHLLKEHLLKEFIYDKQWSLTLDKTLLAKEITQLSYDSRKIDSHTLFFCKGLHFKKEYLFQAMKDGLTCYVSEEPYDTPSGIIGIIVTDIKKAMAILSMAFYDFPQKKLKVIGFTGTKGKTTAAYFTNYILNQTTNQHTAMLSTMNSTLDGKTFFKSQLTTPESLDLYRMMAQAVDNQMTHFIMEVSSQAYKTQRVYGLIFDVGIFLNITPDHISPIEHPTFDDYFYCKRQLINHSKVCVLNQESNYFELLKESAVLAGTPFITYGHERKPDTDYYFDTKKDDTLTFELISTKDTLTIAGTYHLRLAGDFNKSNAVSAAIASSLVGATLHDCQQGIEKTTVPGRMELLTNHNGAKVYVDYAHNYDSLHHLLSFIQKEHPDGRLIVVIGSTGNKAVSRRKDFGNVLSEFADVAILTTDDPADEEPAAICEQIAKAITSPIEIQTILDRSKAIEAALVMSKPKDAVVLAGKGADLYQKIKGVDVFYPGDFSIAENYINQHNEKI